MAETEVNLKKRTKSYAIRIIKFVEYLNKQGAAAARIIANRQLLRSGTAVAANSAPHAGASPGKILYQKSALLLKKLMRHNYG